MYRKKSTMTTILFYIAATVRMEIFEKADRLTWRLAMVPFIVICAYYTWKSAQFPLHDFSNYYFPARLLIDGKLNPDIYDPYTFNQSISNYSEENVFACFSPNPPSVSILFSPFAFFSSSIGKVIFNVISILLFTLSIFRLCGFLKLSQSLAFIFIPVIFFVPLKNNLLFGQSYLLLCSLIIEGYLAHKSDRPFASAFFWMIAIFLKVFPGILFGYLLIKKKFKEATILLAFCIMFLIICIAVQGTEIWKYFLTVVLPSTTAGEINSAYSVSLQSAHMIFKYLFVLDPVLNPHPVFDSRIFASIGVALYTTIMLTLSLTAVQKVKNDLLIIGILLLGMQLISPQGSTYSNLLLIITAIAIQGNISTIKSIIVFVLVFLISNLPAAAFQNFPVPFSFPRLLLLLTLFATLVSFEKIYPNMIIGAAIMILTMASVLLKIEKPRDSNSYFIIDKNHPLIFDLGLENGYFYYKFWDDEGAHKITSITTLQSFSQKGLKIFNDQIFLNDQQITNSSGHKIKPALINKNEIVYLSDDGRGLGFYAIRSFKLRIPE
jgi:hypothetical protein